MPPKQGVLRQLGTTGGIDRPQGHVGRGRYAQDCVEALFPDGSILQMPPSLCWAPTRSGRSMLSRALLRRPCRLPLTPLARLPLQPPLRCPIAPASAGRFFASTAQPPNSDEKPEVKPEVKPSRWQRIKTTFREHGPVFVGCALVRCFEPQALEIHTMSEPSPSPCLRLRGDVDSGCGCVLRWHNHRGPRRHQLAQVPDYR